MTTVLASLTPEAHKEECIKHALAVRSAWALNNYHRFFKLYTNAPKMSGYLMDWFAERARKSAVKAVVKSYVFLLLYLEQLVVVSVHAQIFRLGHFIELGLISPSVML